FGIIGIVSMSGTVSVHDIAIVSGTLVVIIDHDRNGGSRCRAFENTRENLYFIVFLSGGRVTALASVPPVQIRLDIICRERKTGRTSVDNGADGGTVGFSPSCDGE